MEKTTVLVTCVGTVTSPSHIDSLRRNPEGRSLRIIGVDMTTPCIGQYITDKFYLVPPGLSPDYLNKILEICSEESVEVLFPASHEEALILAKNRDLFQKIGTTIVISKPEVLELAFNKKLAYRKLQVNNLPCPRFRIVSSVPELEEAATDLGIDQHNLVIKPIMSRGGRGTRILTKKNSANSLLNEKPGTLIANYSSIITTLKELNPDIFPELVLMEYLPGQIYSVDFLAKNGKTLAIVPKVRIIGNPSQTIVGMVQRSTSIENMIKKISGVFKFDYTVNIELGTSLDGRVLPFDLNPRLGASTAFCSAAGANLIYYALKMALGESVPTLEVKDKTMMIRYFKEHYVLSNNN